MCDKNTQILSQIEIESQTNGGPEDKNDVATWARLYPINSQFQSFDLKKDTTNFGRAENNDVNLANVKTHLCPPTSYSGLHFIIKREFTGKTGHHALLQDMSSNGTFINGEKIGKGRVQALKNNSEISLSLKENKAFIFIDMSCNDDHKYPAEIRQKYTITKMLGVGAYGEVRLAFEKNNCNKYAIKIIQKKKFSINGKHEINSNSQIKSEIDILKKLKHPCIIRVHEVVDTIDSVFIILDLAEGGELFDKVVKLGRYEESTAKLLFYQMVLTIKYLHDKGITHRDLKPENILLASDKNETLIKVTDFGLSKFFNSASMMKTFCGTPNYLAPEVLFTKGEGKYSNKVDNWSLGVILYIILVGFPPFSDENLEAEIKQGSYDFFDQAWSNISGEAKDVIRKLMCVDPVKRSSLEAILEHTWFKNDTKMIEEAAKIMGIEEEFLLSCGDGGYKGGKKRGLEGSSSELIENSNKRLKNLDL